MTILQRTVARVLGLSLCLSNAVHAAWVVEPTLQVQGRYSDNMTLSSADEDSGLATSATAQARVLKVTERASIAAAAGVTYEAHSGVDSLDDEHREFVDIIAERSGERTSLRLESSARFDTLLRSGQFIDDPFQFDAGGEAIGEIDSDLDDLVAAQDTEIGSVTEQIDRIRIQVRPSLSYALSERMNGVLGVEYSSQNYDVDSFSTVEDSESFSVSLGINRALSERTSMDYSVAAARNEADQSPDSDFYRASVGVRHRFSERLSVNLGVGGHRVEDDIRKENGFFFDFRGDLRTQTGVLTVSGSRSLLPSWFGTVDETDRVAVSYNGRISDRLSFSLRAAGLRRDSGNPAGGGDDRDYFDARTGLDWRMTEKWTIGGAYIYRWTDRKTDVDTASSNSVSLSLSYRPPRRPGSR